MGGMDWLVDGWADADEGLFIVYRHTTQAASAACMILYTSAAASAAFYVFGWVVFWVLVGGCMCWGGG